jgi:hypothetical protein
LVVLLLRRMTCNLLALFRPLTQQRSQAKRAMSWRTAMRGICGALTAANPQDVTGLRQRGLPPDS